MLFDVLPLSLAVAKQELANWQLIVDARGRKKKWVSSGRCQARSPLLTLKPARTGHLQALPSSGSSWGAGEQGLRAAARQAGAQEGRPHGGEAPRSVHVCVGMVMSAEKLLIFRAN